MDVVSHRELRNSSGEVLRRVAAGEFITITNNGRPVAVIGPTGRSDLDALAARGDIRRALRPVASLGHIVRKKAPVDSSELLRDTRGTW